MPKDGTLANEGYTFNCAIGIENMGTWPSKEKINKSIFKRKKDKTIQHLQ
jgi:hypothetical protein